MREQTALTPIAGMILLTAMILFLQLVCGAATNYVNVSSTNPVSPYVDWSTAATTIQEAINAAVDGNTVLVSNGTYSTGGFAVFDTMTNRIAITKPITVKSVRSNKHVYCWARSSW